MILQRNYKNLNNYFLYDLLQVLYSDLSSSSSTLKRNLQMLEKHLDEMNILRGRRRKEDVCWLQENTTEILQKNCKLQIRENYWNRKFL